MDQKPAQSLSQDELNRIIIPRKFDCPVCKAKFESWDVASYKVRIIKSDTDLRNYFVPFDPLYYAAIVCPSCGYAALRNYFSKITAKQGALIMENITREFRPKEYPQIYTIDDAIDRYKQALKSAVIKKGPGSEISLICLQLSWLYRDLGDEDSEAAYRQKALEGFAHAYQNERFPMAGMDAPTLQYLIGELYRRSGNLSEAMKYISEVVVMRGIPERLKERAVDVKELIAAERKYMQDIEKGKKE